MRGSLEGEVLSSACLGRNIRNQVLFDLFRGIDVFGENWSGVIRIWCGWGVWDFAVACDGAVGVVDYLEVLVGISGGGV